MKLQRLAGFGPAAAFVSALAIIVVGVLNQLGGALPPSIFVYVAIAFMIALALFVAALTVTLFDLEWLEHPATSTPRIQAALGATLVALFMPAVVALIEFAGLPVPLPIPYAIYFIGIGLSLLLHNLEARRAGLVRGALTWIGIVDGAFFIVLGTLEAIFMFTPALVMGFVYGLPVTQLLCVVWAVWMGVHLMRSKAPAPVIAAAAAN